MKKIYKNRFTFILLISVVSWNTYSQQTAADPIKNPPITTEALFGNRGMSFQMIIDKKFQSIPRLGFFSVTNLVGEWDNNRIEDYMTQANLTFEFAKGFKLTGGFHVTPVTGIRPTAGVMYTYANPDWLVVVNSRTDLSQDINVEGLVLVEYKPKINDTWRFYSRVQGLYEYNTVIEKHYRSYVVARAGVSIKEFTFGVGANIDYYGPAKHNENNVGGFLSFQLL